MSNEKNPSCFGYVGDNTAQLYGDYNKPTFAGGDAPLHGAQWSSIAVALPWCGFKKNGCCHTQLWGRPGERYMVKVKGNLGRDG